jgi:5-deoxy-glucuronate isomerase
VIYIRQLAWKLQDVSPYALYAPPRTEITLTPLTDAEIAVAGAPAKGQLPARLIQPAAMRRSVRGT